MKKWILFVSLVCLAGTLQADPLLQWVSDNAAGGPGNVVDAAGTPVPVNSDWLVELIDDSSGQVLATTTAGFLTATGQFIETPEGSAWSGVNVRTRIYDANTKGAALNAAHFSGIGALGWGTDPAPPPVVVYNGGSVTAGDWVSLVPEAQDGNAVVDEDGSVQITLVATDVDNDPLTYAIATLPSSGAVALNGNVATYTPDPDFNGGDSFSFTADDGNHVSAPATVSITVNAINDPPAFLSDPISGGIAVAGEAYSGSISGSAADVDFLDVLTYEKVSGPDWLTVAGDGSLSGVPPAADEGLNIFTVRVEDTGLAADTAVLNITVETGGAEPVADFASSESTSQGTVTAGTLADTVSNDDVYEVLTEEQTGGSPSKRRSQMEHTWTLNVTGDELVTFYVEAHHSANTENDDFTFAYSTDGQNFTDMLTVTKTADDNTAQYYSLPSGLSGAVQVRVIDTDRSQGNSITDSLYVDALFIVSEAADSAPGPAVNPVPSDGTTGVSLSPVLGWDAGMFASTHDVYFGTNPVPGASEFVGNQSGVSYAPGTLDPDTTYYWSINEVNGAGTTLGGVWSFTTASATPQMHVSSIDPGTQRSGKNYKGQATVVVVDSQSGLPVSGATVSGTFSGAFSESGSAVTDATGAAVLITGAKAPLPFSFTFTVTDVTASSHAYNPSANVETSDTGSF